MYLKFRNFNLKDKSVYITVRRGIKWAMTEPNEFGYGCIDINEEIDIDNNVYKIKGFAEPLEIKIYRFCDISEKDLYDEHDENCHTVSGLFNELSKCYYNFSEKEIVTIIRFKYYSCESS